MGTRLFYSRRNRGIEERIGSEAIQLSEEEQRSIDEEVRHDTRAHLLTMPFPDPKTSVMITSSGHRINAITARHYKKWFKKQYTRLREMGAHTFLCDYFTPLGLMAVEELQALRRQGEQFELYAIRLGRKKKTYRLFKERQLDVLILAAQCDYNYGCLYDLFLEYRVLRHYGICLSDQGICRYFEREDSPG